MVSLLGVESGWEEGADFFTVSESINEHCSMITQAKEGYLCCLCRTPNNTETLMSLVGL